MGGFAWVTLATNDPYALGALVLAHSLKRVQTKHDIAVLITPGVTITMREKLANVFTVVQEVNVLDSQDQANLALLARPELGITFTKLHCWRLTQYDKCVFVDADALVILNCDELFEREELSAAPDVGWPDCFNSGVFVFKPSQQTFASLTAFAVSQGSFDGGDQGLLNLYFSDWAHKDISKHLPFIYNMCSTATYSYLPAYKQFGSDVRIIHFIGSTKPWLQYFDTQTGQVHPTSGSEHLQPLLQQWWDIFCADVHRELSSVMTGIAGALANLTLGEARNPEQVAYEEHMRKQSWEQGQIDYMGRDSFDNIWKKICTTLSVPNESEEPPEKKNLATEKKEELVSKSKTSVAEPVTVTGNKTVAEASKSTIETSEGVSSKPVEPILALTCALPKLCIKESGEKSQEFKTIVEEKKQDPPTPTVIALGPPTVIPDATNANLEIQESSIDATKSILNSTPVTIQVAESVLETVSEDIKPVTEEAISSISAQVQESITAVVETPLESSVSVHAQPAAGTRPVQANGIAELDDSAESVSHLRSVALAASLPPVLVREEEVNVQEARDVTQESRQALEDKSTVSKKDDTVVPATAPEPIPETSGTGTKSAENVQKATTDDKEEAKTSSNIPEEAVASCNKPYTELQIPGTPIVIAATPPTSPPLEVTENPKLVEKSKPASKKLVKKVEKKSSPDAKSEETGEEENKKPKKVTKKTSASSSGKEKLEEGAEGSSTAPDTVKKVIKVKKTTKSGLTLKTDSSVPDTPPPTTSETPVPPKRKVKSATTKVPTTNKSEPES